MRFISPLASFTFLTLASLAVAKEPTSALAGHWLLDATRSTELSPWKEFDLTIKIANDTVVIQRKLGWGRRQFADSMTLDTTKLENVVPIEMWPDNRHIGAYIGRDRTERARATWLDDHRILRLSSDLVLETQQGERAVNILRDFKVSASGRELTLTELRSTRNRPIVYIFKRADP
jgi:hypothetical protein